MKIMEKITDSLLKQLVGFCIVILGLFVYATAQGLENALSTHVVQPVTCPGPVMYSRSF